METTDLLKTSDKLSQVHIPKGTMAELQKPHHGLNHVQQGPIPPLGHTIQLRYSKRSPLRENRILLKVHHKFTEEIFTTSIRSKDFNTLSNLFFHIITSSFEHFKRFRFMSHERDITMPRKVICECNEISASYSRTNHNGSTYISMYGTQKL